MHPTTTSGTGNGTAAYSVDANTGAARSGGLTIAGQTFVVNQAAGVTTPSGLNIAGTWSESISGERNGTQRVTLSQSAGSVTGSVIGNSVDGLTTSSSITGTVSGSAVSLTEVDRFSATSQGLSVSCTITVRYALTGTTTLLTGNYTTAETCSFNVGVPIPSFTLSGSGTARFTKQ